MKTLLIFAAFLIASCCDDRMKGADEVCKELEGPHSYATIFIDENGPDTIVVLCYGGKFEFE